MGFMKITPCNANLIPVLILYELMAESFIFLSGVKSFPQMLSVCTNQQFMIIDITSGISILNQSAREKLLMWNALLPRQTVYLVKLACV